MKNLLWKQWRECRGYLAMFTAYMVLTACYVIGYELGHHYRTPIGCFSGWALFYSSFAAIVLAVRLSHGERTDGTMAFSAALPVSMRRMAATRIAGALATLCIPIVIGAAILSIALVGGLVEQAKPRLVDNYMQLPLRATAPLGISIEQLWSAAAIAMLGGAELLLLLSLLGCYLRSQSQIGLMGAILALGSQIAAPALRLYDRNPRAQLIYGILLPQSLAIQLGYSDETGGYTDHELAAYRWIAMSLSLFVLFAIGYVFTRCYGKIRTPATARKQPLLGITFPPIFSRLSIPLPGRLPAMIWLELRQSIPLAVFGLLLAILLSIASVLIEAGRGPYFGSSLLMEMPHSTFIVAMLWAIVVGSGLFSADLGAGLGAFWRSRPISPNQWFWTKFSVGLIAVLGVLDGVTILITWNSPRISPSHGMSWAYVACFPIQHALLYALAVLGTCWFRRPVIGGILALLGYGLLTVGITAFPATKELDPVEVYNTLYFAERSGRIDFTQHGYPLVYGVLVASIILLAILSCRLARPLQPRWPWLVPGRPH